MKHEGLDKRAAHPSGRPIRETNARRLSITRNPGEGPLTERMRHPQPRDAIGFHRLVVRDEEDE
jgi:hypothetical protein